jgi:hypothetical protein
LEPAAFPQVNIIDEELTSLCSYSQIACSWYDKGKEQKCSRKERLEKRV